MKSKNKLDIVKYFIVIAIMMLTLFACEKYDWGSIIDINFEEVAHIGQKINSEELTVLLYVQEGTNRENLKPVIKVPTGYIIYDQDDNEYVKGESEYDFSKPVEFLIKDEDTYQTWIWTVIVEEDIVDWGQIGIVDNDMWWADTRWRRNGIPMRVGVRDLDTQLINWHGPHFPNNEEWNSLDEYGTRIRWAWWGCEVELIPAANASVVIQWKFKLCNNRAYPQLFTGFELSDPPIFPNEKDGLLLSVTVNENKWYEHHLYNQSPPNLWLNLIEYRGEEVTMSWEIAPGPNGMDSLTVMRFQEPWFTFGSPHIDRYTGEKGRDSEPVIVPWDPR